MSHYRLSDDHGWFCSSFRKKKVPDVLERTWHRIDRAVPPRMENGLHVVPAMCGDERSTTGIEYGKEAGARVCKRCEKVYRQRQRLIRHYMDKRTLM